MTKRYFRVTLAGYGGEFTMGKISEEFYERWVGKEERLDDEPSIEEYVCSMEFDEDLSEFNSPTILEEGNRAWHDIDELSHNYGCYSDSWYFVEEITGPELTDDIVEGTEELRYDVSADIGYERYTAFQDGPIEDTVPVLMCHSSEKGGFGQFIVESDTDFDPKKMTFIVVESDLCELVEGACYDGNQVDIDHSWSDTVGKAFYSRVGRVRLDWLDDYPTDNMIEDYFEEY